MTKYKFKVYTDQNDFNEYTVYAKDGADAIGELRLGVDGHDGTAYYVYVLED